MIFDNKLRRMVLFRSFPENQLTTFVDWDELRKMVERGEDLRLRTSHFWRVYAFFWRHSKTCVFWSRRM